MLKLTYQIQIFSLVQIKHQVFISVGLRVWNWKWRLTSEEAWAFIGMNDSGAKHGVCVLLTFYLYFSVNTDRKTKGSYHIKEKTIRLKGNITVWCMNSLPVLFYLIFKEGKEEEVNTWALYRFGSGLWKKSKLQRARWNCKSSKTCCASYICRLIGKAWEKKHAGTPISAFLQLFCYVDACKV